MTKKKKQAIATMPSYHLPEEILEEIFARLPWRSLMQFRCVCRYFCALFGSRGFQNTHHELSKIKNRACIMFRDPSREEMYKIDYKSVSSLLPLSASSTTMCASIHRMDYPSIFYDCKEVRCLSSCGGLVWLHLSIGNYEEYYYLLSQEYCIWNSTTNECEIIPMVPEVNFDGICGYGFDYDHKANDYKLVAVAVDRVAKCSGVYVYTFGSNSWEKIQSIPYYLHYQHIKEGVLFNGGFHWLARTVRDKSTVLVCLDIVNERFQEVALPETPMPYPEEPLEEEDMFSISVGVLGGCLCLIYCVFNVRVDVWIMQDYGVKESWTRSFSITEENIISAGWCLKLAWSFKNNETLWEVGRGLILYDPNNKRDRELLVDSDYERLTLVESYG